MDWKILIPEIVELKKDHKLKRANAKKHLASIRMVWENFTFWM